MNYNKLFFFIIVLGFSALPLSAKNIDFKKKNKIPTEIEDVQLLFSNSFLVKENKSLKTVNRHRDLINSIVNSKIKCSLNFFTVIRDIAAC